MTGTEVARTAPSGTLALQGNQGDWTEHQRAALAQIGVAEAPLGDQMVLLHVAQRTGLDPFARQIYMIGRKDDQSPGGKKWTIQTGIDGFRVVSERHPQYAGVLDAEWCGDDGVWRDVWVAKTPPVAARFTVIRKDWEHPVRAVAHFEEYAQRKYNGDLNIMWATKSAHMISKCAEALARRRAFPQDLASVYTEDEMAHVDNPPMVIIQSERERAAVPPAEPDWDALITEHEAARDVGKLWDLRKLAQGMRPNDGPLLNRIAEAWQRTKSTVASAEATTQPPNKNQMNRLFALLSEAGVKTDDARHRLAAHVLERDDVATFKDLTADDVSALITRLEKLKGEGRLGAQADSQTPAEQPETPANIEGVQ